MHPTIDLDNRFNLHKPQTTKVAATMTFMRESTKSLAQTVIDIVPPGREQSLALTALEEALFWANAGIARNQEPVVLEGTAEFNRGHRAVTS